MGRYLSHSMPKIGVGLRAAWLLFGLSALVGLGWGLVTWLFPSVVVEWETGNELDTVGYNVYRSDKPAGDFVRINARLIPAEGDPLAGAQYAYTDTSVHAGMRYYYVLEDINTGGSATRHGPHQVEPVGASQLILAGALCTGGLLGLGALALRRRRSQIR